MSRIRSIRPEFWSSEQVMELSHLARLAFIGLWNFSDDGGVHPASPKTLKAEIFPSDDLTAESVRNLVDEMIGQGLVTEFEADGKRFWHVTGWARHQRIDRPTYRHPQPDNSPKVTGMFGEASATIRRQLAEASPPEGNGEEGNGEERSKPTSDEVGSDQASPEHAKLASVIPDCPHQQIITLYTKHLQALPQPRVWEGQRAKNLRARWYWVMTAKRRDGQRYAVDAESALSFFDRFFAYVAESDFLTGRNGKWQGCNLGWLVKADNFAKVLEGQYEPRMDAA